MANTPVDPPRSTDDAFDAPRAPAASAIRGNPTGCVVRKLWRDSAKKTAGRYEVRIIDTFRVTRESGLSDGRKRNALFFPESESIKRDCDFPGHLQCYRAVLKKRRMSVATADE